MTNEEYLNQAYCLERKISSDIEEVNHLREIADRISSPGFTEKVQSSGTGEAPFTRGVEKIMLLEEKIGEEIDTLAELKEQIYCAIARVKDIDEQMVLRYRYINGLSWDRICEKLGVGKSTVWRRHKAGVDHIVLPDNIIKI